MQIEASAVRGFQDYLPPESLKREAVLGIIKKKFKLYGFLSVETPVVEFDELMMPDALEGEDEAVLERFKLKDRAGRNLGLRYEFTFQLSRIFKQNSNIILPFRGYQIGPVFRDGPTSEGKFRQFVQCDADIIGDQSSQAEAECLSVVSDICKELKIGAEIQANNRALLRAIIESVEIRAIKEVMRELDKKQKIGEDLVKLNLKKYADSKQILTLFKLLEKDLKFFRENAFDGAKELEGLQSKCRKYGLTLKFNPFVIRGFSYYTGNIFEFVSRNCIFAGGGRYNKLVGKYAGREIPAVGISLGLDRISKLADVEIENIDVIVISINKENETIKLLKRLREAKISVIPLFEKADKALELADSLKIPYVIFVDREERYKLRDMESGAERFLAESQIIKEILKAENKKE
jgi:histidyl-tRNA synthetase